MTDIKKKLKAKDIEKLENTSPVLPGQPVGGEVFAETEGCQICVGPTSCCNPNPGDPVCVGPTSCCSPDDDLLNMIRSRGEGAIDAAGPVDVGADARVK